MLLQMKDYWEFKVSEMVVVAYFILLFKCQTPRYPSFTWVSFSKDFKIKIKLKNIKIIQQASLIQPN
jgi:hypothetical protein